jgi:hypothetical protein
LDKDPVVKTRSKEQSPIKAAPYPNDKNVNQGSVSVKTAKS